MAITEAQRLDLHAAARHALGTEEGDALMATLPPANTDIATQQGLDRVESGLRTDLDRFESNLRRDMTQMEASIRKDMTQMEASIRKDMTQMEASIRKDMKQIEASIRNDMKQIEASIRKDLAHHIETNAKEHAHLEERLRAAISDSAKDLSARLMRSIHNSELRTIGVVIAVAIGDRMIG